MGKKIISTLLVLMLFASLELTPLYAAGWVDDWLQQKTETSPGYFEGQKRGYFTAGSFSARWPTKNDYLFTMTTPKIKGGCGGVDMFLGGFSFLNFEYLVQKLQRILQTAPAAAFDIALNTLCEPCAKTIKSLQAIESQLNQIQLDDCKAAKALVATLVKPGFESNEQISGKLSNIQADFKLSTGVDNLFYGVTQKNKANNDDPPDDVLKSALDGCPADIKAVFGETGSVLDKLGQKFGDSAYIDLMRGYVGDVIIQMSDKGVPSVVYVTSCEENKKLGAENFLDGKAFAKNIAGECYKITDTNADLSRWVHDKMINIATQIKDKGTYSPDNAAFVNSSPLPIALALKHAVGTNQEGAIIATLADVTAKAYAHALLSDLYYKIASISEKARALVASQKSSGQDKPAHTCEINMIESAPGMMGEMGDKVYTYLGGVKASYAASANEVNAIMSVVERLQQFYNTAQKSMADKFGKHVSERALGR